MDLISYRQILSSAVVVFLILVPGLWAQVQEQAPLSLTGNLGVGFSEAKDGSFSRSSPIASGDSDLSGFWKDPRILLFDFAPFASVGHSVASSTDVGNRGDGFNSSMTFLGGSILPLSVSYSRSWQDIPNYTNNILSGLSTSVSSSGLSLDTGVYWGKLPPISIHYGSGSNSTDYADGIGQSDNSYNNYSASTYYSLLGWNLVGGYTASHLDARRINLENLGGSTQPETNDTSDLHMEAQGQSRLMSLTFVGGDKKWSDDAPGIEKLDTDFRYVHALGNMHPFSRLNVSFSSGYDSGDVASKIQQLLGVQGVGSSQGVILPGTDITSNSSSVTLGGGAQLILPKGFTLSGGASVGDFSSTSTGSGGSTLLWDAALNYLRKMGRSGTLTASYGYQHSETDGSALSGTSATRTLRVGGSGDVPYGVFLSGNVHFDQRDLESVSLSLGRVNSPGHDYGISVNAARRVSNRLKVEVDFDYSNGRTDYPVYFETKTKSFGVRADSGAWRLSLHRTYQQGLAMQVGSTLVFVGDSQQAVLTPLNTVLSAKTDVQTVLTGTYQPGRKRLRLTGSWVRFGFDNRGVHTTDASFYNFVASYRLRLLQLQAGFYRSSSQAYTMRNSTPLMRRQIYFEVIRHFNLF